MSSHSDLLKAALQKKQAGKSPKATDPSLASDETKPKTTAPKIKPMRKAAGRGR